MEMTKENAYMYPLNETLISGNEINFLSHF